MSTQGYRVVDGGRLRRRGARSGGRVIPWTLSAVATDTRLGYSGRIVAGGLALGMLLSPALWLTRSGAALAESFPMVTALPFLGVLALPAPFDAALLGAVLALCALAAVASRRAIFGALFACCLLLALPDMMRWQPWTYLYLAAIGTLAFVPARGAGGSRLPSWADPLGVLRILVASVYLWSGANKLNHSFFTEHLSGFLAGMPPAISSGPIATALTYSAPGLEMTAGLGLLIGGYRIRHLALAGAVSTNLFVLAALIPAGANVVVWPWNLAMIGLVVILFGGRDGEVASSPRKAPRRRTRRHTAGVARGWGYVYAATVCVLFAVMPAFGVLGYWPSYLSFALYSQNTAEATIDLPVSEGRASVTDMSYEHLNVPAYPSPEVYEVVGERTCALRGSEAVGDDPILMVRERPDILTGSRDVREYGCTPIGLVEESERAAHSP